MTTNPPPRSNVQIIFHASSFVSVLILGNVFDFAFTQARFHVQILPAGKPLPPLSDFFMSNHHAALWLLLLPWLGLVATPLLPVARRKNYWDLNSFVIRYLAFLSVELCLFMVFVAALIAPFVSIYRVSEGAG